ncbi:Aste57867_14410 [Aphanomyces stellatus]|uniref:Aste57867_14410 protein n=1 Tax=Aphanomyces stellatus TaxID=120398 RepID=A0A485L0J4_9STRA|nr:hypothetical protein As57867_014356 [Aphanomyces stellatus]VFT91232.1 Aste57867_14410 [Aphanomyces stellatus]
MTQRQCMEDTDDEDLLQITGDAKLKRRIYDRKKQRRYREALVTETTQLRALIADLELQVTHLTVRKHGKKGSGSSSRESSPTKERANDDDDEGGGGPFLSWKDVAVALRDDLHLQHQTTHVLEQKTAMYRDLISKMATWVTSSSTTQIGRPLRPMANWRHVSLPADPIARQCGMQWITQQLYHNADAMFDRYAFPNAPHAVADDMHFDFTDIDCYQFVFRFQIEVFVPASVLATHFMQNVWSYVMVGVVLPSTTTERTISTDGLVHHLIQTPMEFANLISRAFYEPTRVVLVGQQIHDDEAEPHDHPQRHRMLWFSLDALTPTRTRIRLLYLTSQSFTRTGFTPLEDEARMWRCDLSDCATDALKLAHFQAYVKSIYDDLAKRGKVRLSNSVAAAAKTPPSTP